MHKDFAASCISLQQIKASKLIHFVPYILLLQSTNLWAACSTNGDISSGVLPIVLDTPGCADDGSMQAQLLASNTLNVTGSGITAPIVIGSIVPWTITLQSNSSLIATGNGIVGIDGVGALPVTLINHGSINAGTSGALLTGGGHVTNYGDITATFNGIDISSENGGTVFSPVLNSQVDNYGSILGGTTGIHLGLGGTINNHGTIDGVFAIQTEASQSMIPSAPLTLNNFGAIGDLTMTNTGVLVNGGATISNNLGGQILAGTYGIAVQGGAATIYNNGTITASVGRGIIFSDAATSGTINNDVNGVINGFGTRSISFVVCPGTVNNAGTISGGTFATINMQAGSSTVNNSGTIVGDVNFDLSNNTFLMTAGHMSGQLLMGDGGTEKATFQNVTDANIGLISVFNGGGGGNDQLIFDHSQHAGGSDIINWETMTLNNGSIFSLTNTLNLGGLSGDLTATLAINSSTLNANSVLNSAIQSTGHPALVNNAGLINLTSPAANNSLSIFGNYIGNNGLLNLNAVLNSDGSPADKLVIDGLNGGASASGMTRIQVNNTTGAGAQTVANGILLVETRNNATTAADAFALNAPLRVGAFDYRLFRGGLDPSNPLFEQDWFLRSTFLPTPQPININPQPIIGPELSVYTSVIPAAMNINRIGVGTLHERVGDETSLINEDYTSNRHYVNGAWFRGFDQSYHERDASLAAPKASADVYGFQTGLDVYRDKTTAGALNLVGLYAAYATSKPTIEGLITNTASTLNVRAPTGSIHLDARTGGIYWTHFLPNGAYLDLVAQASSFDGNANSFRTSLDLDGFGTAESAEIGYPIPFAPEWTLEPQGQLLHQYVSFNANRDNFSLVDLGASNALIGRAGLRLQHYMEWNTRVMEPYLRANVWSVLAGDRASPVVFAGLDSIGCSANINWAQLGGGFTFNLSPGWNLYAFIDDLVNIGNNRATFNGFDAGLGIRANWA